MKRCCHQQHLRGNRYNIMCMNSETALHVMLPFAISIRRREWVSSYKLLEVGRSIASEELYVWTQFHFLKFFLAHDVRSTVACLFVCCPEAGFCCIIFVFVYNVERGRVSNISCRFWFMMGELIKQNKRRSLDGWTGIWIIIFVFYVLWI